MTHASSVNNPPSDALSEVELLCSLLLEVAGRDTNRIPSARRHVRALDAAFPYMTKAQKDVARFRIDRLQTKWGVLLPGSSDEPENDSIPPEVRVQSWLSLRRHPHLHLDLLHAAACAVSRGATSLTVIMDHAYSRAYDPMIHIRSFDTFSEWLIQLRIAKREAPGIYRPGNLCEWWLVEMDPKGPKTNAYAACLKQQQRWPKNRRWFNL